MDKNTLLERQTAAEAKHTDLTNQIQSLEAQIQPLVNEQVRVEGEHRVLTELVNSFVETETTPVEGEVVNQAE